MLKRSLFIAVVSLGLFLCLSASGRQSVAMADSGGVLAVRGVGWLSLPDWLEAKSAIGLENQRNAGLQYDMVGFNHNTWHYARLVSYKMEQNLGVLALLFSAAESNPQILGELVRPLLAKSLAENGGQILEWTPTAKAIFGGRRVPVITARLIMTEKLPLPMAATVYIFMHKDRLFAVGLFSPDSDRQFWAQQFREMAATLRWE